jgi:hypothetical protein
VRAQRVDLFAAAGELLREPIFEAHQHRIGNLRLRGGKIPQLSRIALEVV